MAGFAGSSARSGRQKVPVGSNGRVAMVVGGVTRLNDGAGPVRRGTERRAFAVRVDRGEPAERAVASSGVSMVSLLSMQEAESDAQQDREARQQGEAMLDELGELQRALLGDGGPDLARLARLASRPVAASDPRLAGVLRAIRLRAGVELARRESVATSR